MTRFARAKGSKASNERVPQEATSWQVMKQQLEQKKQDTVDAKKHKEFENIRKANYKAFLDEREHNVEMKWTEFEESSSRDNNITVKNKKRKAESYDENDKLQDVKHKKKGKKNTAHKDEKLNKQEMMNAKMKTISEQDDDDGKDPKLQNLIAEIEKTLAKKKNAPNGGIQGIDDDDDDDTPEETSAKITQNQKKIKMKLPKKKPLKIPSIGKSIENETDAVLPKNENVSNVNNKKSLKKDKNKKKAKIDPDKPIDNTEKDRNKKKPKINPDKSISDTENGKKKIEDMSEDQLKRFTKKREKKLRQLQRRKIFKAEQREKALKEEQNQNMKKRKLPKERDNKEHKRRKPDSQVTKVNINGVDIEIDYFGGFPVKKEDAERLHKLRKEMISKGIPRNEVQIALKLERRKAEKSLAREKKNVCFNCRKSGHILSECPDLNENASHEVIGTGVCFKCGSTEHTHFECKVIRNDTFKFATCFICREQGHISRQCPDNQKGMYPRGGACRVCGDVTHLKKDCPKFQAEQEAETIKLDTLEFNNVESLPEEKQTTGVRNKNKNKVVKF